VVSPAFAVQRLSATRLSYLQGDTSMTITVNYQTLEDAETSTVFYDTQSRRTKRMTTGFTLGNAP